MWNNIPPPNGLPELAAILKIVGDAGELSSAVQKMEDVRASVNEDIVKARAEIAAAQVEAARILKEAKEAADAERIAAAADAGRVRAAAEKEARDAAAERARVNGLLKARSEILDEREKQFNAESDRLIAERAEILSQSTSLHQRERDLEARLAKLKEIAG